MNEAQMTVKTVTLPSGEKIAFGRKPSPAPRRALKLRQYLVARVAALVPPPAVEDYAPKTVKGSGLAMGLGNYELGDCTCAAAGHIEDIFRAHDDDGLPPITNEEAIALYCEACGYVKGDPSTDNGGTLAEVLAEWKSYGIPGTNASIAGFLTVDPTNQVEVEQAIYLFGNLYIGLSLPDAWINPMPSASGFTWSVAGPPDPQNGHCFTGDTKVSLLDGRELPLADLAGGAAGESFWVYSCDQNGDIVPGHAHSPRLTRQRAQVVRVILDSGEEIRCTPDHQFLLRDGSYRDAARLRDGESLMPLYRRVNKAGYEEFLNPRTQGWRSTHRTVAFGVGGHNPKGLCAHHANFTKSDNSPNNLVKMTTDDHARLHQETAAVLSQYAKSERGRAKSRDLMSALWADPVWRQKMLDALPDRVAAGGRASIAAGGGFAFLDRERLHLIQSENGMRSCGRSRSDATRARISSTRKAMFAADQALLARQAEYAYNASLAATNRPLTSAQIEARQRNIAIARNARAINHKIIAVIPDGYADVYDLTVDVHHNFALSSGVFVHNCVAVYGYNEEGVFINTWGLFGTITWGAFAKYLNAAAGGEVYAVLSEDWVSKATGLAPNGLNYAELEADLASG
jgi:hypothetical protein